MSSEKCNLCPKRKASQHEQLYSFGNYGPYRELVYKGEYLHTLNLCKDHFLQVEKDLEDKHEIISSTEFLPEGELVSINRSTAESVEINTPEDEDEVGS